MSTLLWDLELAARHAVNLAERQRRLGQPGLAKDDEAFAARLYAHAARLRAEDARAVRMSENGQVNVLDIFAAKEARTVLERINGGPVVGPLPEPTEDR